jgi:hypothetical protein
VTQAIIDRIRPSGPHAVVPNGIEPHEWISPDPAPAWFGALPGPRLLYVGSLDHRLDIRLTSSRCADWRTSASMDLQDAPRWQP